MEVILMIVFVTAFWAAVAKFGPRLFSKAEQQDLVHCVCQLTAVCCWLFWLCCYLAQLNPLVGPRLNQVAVKLIAKSWNNPIVEG